MSCLVYLGLLARDTTRLAATSMFFLSASLSLSLIHASTASLSDLYMHLTLVINPMIGCFIVVACEPC
jgi:hypothetical protein